MFEYRIGLDGNNPNFDKNVVYTNMSIHAKINYLNDLLYVREYVFLRDIQEIFDVPITKSGIISGWKKGDVITFNKCDIWEENQLGAVIITLQVPHEDIMDIFKD